MKKISFIATVTISLVWLAHAGFAGCVSSDNYDPDIFYCTTGDTLSCDGVLNHECYEIGDRGNAFYYDYCRFNSFDGLYHCYMSAEAPPDDPPTAFITVPSTATAGQSITLYGSGTDETDINRITAYYQGAYRSQDCTGTQTTCSKSWSITESSAGTYTYYIYVYDNAGHESSPASATVTWSAPAATTTTTTTSSTTTTLPGATCTEGLVCISGDAYYQYSDCRRDIDERCNGRGCTNGACNDAPASPTTTTTSTTTTTLPAGTCAPHSYPTTYWQRNWYIYDGGQGACLGTGPNQDLFNFDDNWQTGTLAYSRIDGIMFSSTRSFSVQGGGIFDFVVGSDDGSVLYVNGIARHNDWSNHDYREKYVQSELREGSNTLQLDYYEKPYNFFTTNKARVAFLGPYSSQTVDVTTLKSEYNDGEDIRANALLYGSGFQSGNYKIRFFLNGHDTGKSCSVTVSTTQASNMCTSTTSPPPAGCTVETDKVYLPIVNYLCSASIPSPGPGLAHELLAKVYINDFELLSPVWDAEPVAVNSAPAPTTTTTTVPSPQRCDTNTDCLISYGHDTATNIQYVCNSPQGLPTSNTAIGLNTCYVPPTCMGNQKYPDGSDIKSTLCRPSYCCSGELSSTIGGGSCVNPGGTRGSGNYLCVG